MSHLLSILTITIMSFYANANPAGEQKDGPIYYLVQAEKDEKGHWQKKALFLPSSENPNLVLDGFQQDAVGLNPELFDLSDDELTRHSHKDFRSSELLEKSEETLAGEAIVEEPAGIGSQDPEALYYVVLHKRLRQKKAKYPKNDFQSKVVEVPFLSEKIFNLSVFKGSLSAAVEAAEETGGHLITLKAKQSGFNASHPYLLETSLRAIDDLAQSTSRFSLQTRYLSWKELFFGDGASQNQRLYLAILKNPLSLASSPDHRAFSCRVSRSEGRDFWTGTVALFTPNGVLANAEALKGIRLNSVDVDGRTLVFSDQNLTRHSCSNLAQWEKVDGQRQLRLELVSRAFPPSSIHWPSLGVSVGVMALAASLVFVRPDWWSFME